MPLDGVSGQPAARIAGDVACDDGPRRRREVGGRAFVPGKFRLHAGRSGSRISTATGNACALPAMTKRLGRR